MEINGPDRPGAASARAPYSSAGLVTVRPAVAADADACGRVMHDAFRGIADAHGFPPDFASVSDAAGLAAVLIADPAVFGVVAEVGGRVVGSNFLAEGDAVRGVGPITVELSHQGGGIGWRLMAAILERAGPGAPVRLVQDAFNTRSVALYASLGFEVKEPLLLLRGAPRVGPPLGSTVRPLLDRDVAACAELCAAVHGGITRTHELRGARRLFAPVVVERGGRIVGYLTAPGLWLANHGVAETEEDMRALLAGAAAGGGPVSLLLPTRQAGLFRWCLGAGMRVVKPMTLMAKGGYGEPRGCWFPSVFY